MDFYNYMLTIQQEVMKACIKKGEAMRIQKDTTYGYVYIADPTGQSALSVPDRLFVLDINHPDGRAMPNLVQMFNEAKNSMCIELTNDIFQTNRGTQLVKMRAPESGTEIWINSKFLGYFKGVKHLRYGYFGFRESYIVCAYLDTNFTVLGITIPLKPKREGQA